MAPGPVFTKKPENKDQAQNQTYKLQILDKKYCKFNEICTILSEE